MREIQRALLAAHALEKILKERYAGQLWQDEEMAAKIDPHIQWKDDNLKKLNTLKEDITKFVATARKEFEVATGQDTSELFGKDNEK